MLESLLDFLFEVSLFIDFPDEDEEKEQTDEPKVQLDEPEFELNDFTMQLDEQYDGE